MEELLNKLCSTYTVSGSEIESFEIIKDLFDEDTDITVDAIGNIIMSIGNKDGKDVTTLLVQTVNVNGYNEFTDASRILMSFADEKAVRLNRVPGSEVQKRKYSKKNGNATISYYETITSYEVSNDVIERLEKGIAVIKVRVVFKENDAKDYDIVESYQEKMAADLLKSYQDASLNNRKSNTDLSDEDF